MNANEIKSLSSTYCLLSGRNKLISHEDRFPQIAVRVQRKNLKSIKGLRKVSEEEMVHGIFF